MEINTLEGVRIRAVTSINQSIIIAMYIQRQLPYIKGLRGKEFPVFEAG